jgi:hypothetical protein
MLFQDIHHNHLSLHSPQARLAVAVELGALLDQQPLRTQQLPTQGRVHHMSQDQLPLLVRRSITQE